MFESVCSPDGFWNVRARLSRVESVAPILLVPVVDAPATTPSLFFLICLWAVAERLGRGGSERRGRQGLGGSGERGRRWRAFQRNPRGETHQAGCVRRHRRVHERAGTSERPAGDERKGTSERASLTHRRSDDARFSALFLRRQHFRRYPRQGLWRLPVV